MTVDQKSTTTGMVDWITTDSKFAFVTSIAMQPNTAI
jgi:hypothetical protein